MCFYFCFNRLPSLSLRFFLSCSLDEPRVVDKMFILSDSKWCLSYFGCIGKFESAFDAYRAYSRLYFCRVSVKYVGNSKTRPYCKQCKHNTRIAYSVDSKRKKKTITTTSTNIFLSFPSFSSASIGQRLRDALYDCILPTPK